MDQDEKVIFKATPGQGARGCLRTYRNDGDQAGRHWVVTTLSGVARFLARSADQLGGGGRGMERIVVIAAEHGIEIRALPSACASAACGSAMDGTSFAVNETSGSVRVPRGAAPFLHVPVLEGRRVPGSGPAWGGRGRR